MGDADTDGAVGRNDRGGEAEGSTSRRPGYYRSGIYYRHRGVIYFHQINGNRRNLPNIPRYHVEITGQQDQGFGLGATLEGEDFLHRRFVGGVAADTPNRIRWIQNQPAAFQHLKGLAYYCIDIHVVTFLPVGL